MNQNTEIEPTLDHLSDPYVLQLIKALSMRQDEVERLLSEGKGVLDAFTLLADHLYTEASIAASAEEKKALNYAADQVIRLLAFHAPASDASNLRECMTEAFWQGANYARSRNGMAWEPEVVLDSFLRSVSDNQDTQPGAECTQIGDGVAQHATGRKGQK